MDQNYAFNIDFTSPFWGSMNVVLALDLKTLIFDSLQLLSKQESFKCLRFELSFWKSKLLINCTVMNSDIFFLCGSWLLYYAYLGRLFKCWQNFFCYYVTKVARELTFPKIKDSHNGKRQKQKSQTQTYSECFIRCQPLFWGLCILHSFIHCYLTLAISIERLLL